MCTYVYKVGRELLVTAHACVCSADRVGISSGTEISLQLGAEAISMMTLARVLWFCSLLLCQALRWVGAAAPGDEDEACRVPNYSASIAVLMDSWRYQSILSETSPVWETSDRGPGSSDLVRKRAYTSVFASIWSLARLSHGKY